MYITDLIKPALARFVVLVGLVALVGSVVPASAFEADEKIQIEQIVRDYLLNNPEIFIEVQQALETKRKSQALAQAKRAINEQGDLIFRSKNQFSIGAKDADVTIVEFFDYNCPFCQRAMGDMIKMLKDDKKLNFVMKELPILSEGSVEAHRVSIAVGRMAPEKYAEYHKRLLTARGQKNGKRALKIAAEMGFDAANLGKLARDESINDAFREVNDLANALGISGTPSYVIGDEVIFGALGEKVLREKVANMRKCGSTTCL